MALCLAESLLNKNFCDPIDQLNRYETGTNGAISVRLATASTLDRQYEMRYPNLQPQVNHSVDQHIHNRLAMDLS